MCENRALRVFMAVVFVAWGSLAPSALAQKPATSGTEAIDPTKELETGKRAPLCPQLRLPASHTSLKVLVEEGVVYGSGLTGQRPSIAKCVNGRVVWQRELNTIPTTIVGSGYAALYAGMTQGKKVALGVGEVDTNGKELWFRKIDSPGDELGAVAALGSSDTGASLYVLSGSTGKLAGQPAGAKGHRFLARFSLSRQSRGKLLWAKQSRAFGRRPSPKGDGDDGTPAALATDARGGVYVLSALDPTGVSADEASQARVAKLTKLDEKGKQVWQRVISVDVKALGVPSFRGTLRTMTVDDDGSSVFVAGEAVGETGAGILVMRLDRTGMPRWTKVVPLTYEVEWKVDDGGKMEVAGWLKEVRGITVNTDTLLVVAAYRNVFYETWDSGEDEEDTPGMGDGSRDSNNVAVVASLDSVHGKLRWARQYEGLGRDYGSASEFRPSGIQDFNNGTVAITGSEDLWVATTSQRFEDVPALFLLQDVKVEADYGDGLPYAAEIEFYDQLRAAVKRKDKQWVADHSVFPLHCAYPSGTPVPNKAAFLEDYDDIFSANVLAAIDYTKREMAYRDREGMGITISDNTLFFDWLEAKGGRKAGYYVKFVDNSPPYEEPATAAPAAATGAPAATADTPPGSAEPKSEAPAEAKPETKSEAAQPTASKKDKMKNWFKEQHRQAQEKNKQKQQN